MLQIIVQEIRLKQLLESYYLESAECFIYDL